MNFTHPRMQREAETIEAMINIYCKDHHGPNNGPCNDCQSLLEYAGKRLQSCPFQENKTTCGNCPIHCYQANMRQKIREVMRYAGPKMPLRHPVLALWHIFDGFKKAGNRKK